MTVAFAYPTMKTARRARKYLADRSIISKVTKDGGVKLEMLVPHSWNELQARSMMMKAMGSVNDVVFVE